ncbi:conserved Plasmodium protein, unknown function [Plasmodium berghei]|uniref:Uncharacterized protein n=2 Tax=Plasmodium berghei TaxID=5821 RepID=A0A509ARN9_PLABA|nr:conserved Plasmodium protein, unknown function [Plasmodium berghei ANKA]CXI92254.1 conserved Plasmodium protein, unknown function [Plasmodium berghei]SCL96594.1 conserved Plasmodium protein, unknown function [Plasmodium berghei]SCM16454.1 conserved Plasmodium protein, unknown function [Plasmodium berghei]SCM18248.1 conserved Plasmodium protein, unknown function [Plasmodium berghei]SCN27676.1 conserved Plasmodium protein, unknown function [Plasmodium berghei]|eukprot:XP_034423331.1 conserved Plasmodium protein, unknown function [Plasmodium berghei ANKA]
MEQSRFNSGGLGRPMVTSGRTLIKSNITFVDNEDTYSAESLKTHLQNLKKLKEDIIRNRNASKDVIKEKLNFLFYNYDTNCNFDVFYDKCLEIITRYLIVYKEINDILMKNNIQNNTNANKNSKSNSFFPFSKKKNTNTPTKDVIDDVGNVNSNNILYNLIDNKKLVYNNKFLFDYDDDHEIYTSSEEEIIIEGSIRKSTNYGNSNKNENKKMNGDGETYDRDNLFLKGEKGKAVRNFEKKKINLLNRYPEYLRDLIKIVRTAKYREKKILQINFINEYLESMDLNKLNTLFNELYIINSYINNKSYVEKKKKRLLYRIIRNKMINSFYNNHSMFIEKLLKKNKDSVSNLNYNNLCIENIEKFFESHTCDSENANSCKICQEKIQIFFYIIIYHNLNYMPILKKMNNKKDEERNLLTNIFINKIKKRKPINVDYEISYHKDKSIYMVSKNNIFCHIMHEKYIQNNFNDLLLRIKNGSKGYNILNIIFNKYKNKRYLSVNKLSSILDNFSNGKASYSKSDNGIVLKESFFDALRNKIINDENNKDLFFDQLFCNFYDILYTSRLSQYKDYNLSKNANINVVDEKIEDSDSDNLDITYHKSDKFEVNKNNKTHKIMSYLKNKKFDNVSLKEMSSLYMNVKNMDNIDDAYIGECTWENNNNYNYYYISKNKKSGNEKNSKYNNHPNTFQKYLENLNEEVAIVVNSDDSDDYVKNSTGKAKNLINYLKGRSIQHSVDPSKNKNIILVEKFKMMNLKNNTIINPLINSNCIGFKINVNDVGNRNLDVYCISNNEYVSAYKNTVKFLKNNINSEVKKNYTYLNKVKKNIKKVNDNENTVNDVIEDVKKKYGNKNYININDKTNDNNSTNNINEYIVVIDENVEEDKYSIDIYDYAELTTYIVTSKKEKKKEFYRKFVKNEIYSHKWINKLQFKLQYYNNIYKNSYFKKQHMKSIRDYLYSLLINAYYENIYDVSLNLLLSNYYEQYNLNKKFILKNIHFNLNEIYMKLLECIKNDILNNSYILREGNLTEDNLLLKINDYLINYKWDNENRRFIEQIIHKYRYIFLYYVLYTYPKFLQILNIIQINNFRESIKMSLPDEEDKHIQDAQKDFTSKKKILKSVKKNKSEQNTNIESENKNDLKNTFLPEYYTNPNNDILEAIPLKHLLLINPNERFKTSFFLNILTGKLDITKVQKEIHPICYKTMLYYKHVENGNAPTNTGENPELKKETTKIRKKLKITEIANLFIILNSYLSFLSVQANIFFNDRNLWKHLIYKDSSQEMKMAFELSSGGNSYFPSNFINSFLDTFLLKNNDKYIIADELKCKLMVYILLIQLCLTDNYCPIKLLFVNHNVKLILKKLNFSIVNGQFITFKTA